ncbi:Iron-stress related protein [Melia azedarach]|uniref:Iron-stress related protein n=1 Tax=Melia azedarach TaxID=155640 RepID=A0ACC1Z3R0_MELAZ|nr:Iron-stress related protein [Melia azedarach]
MLENPTQTAAAAADASPVVKRYAPPNQRNRSVNRRKSGDRFDRSNNVYGNGGEKNQFATSRNTPGTDHGDMGSSNPLNVNSQPKLITLEGFSRSEAAQLLKDRGRAAMKRYNDPLIDLSERPVLYSSGASAWGQFRLPHQMLPPSNSTGPTSGSQMDFLAELRRKMQNSGAKFDN